MARAQDIFRPIARFALVFAALISLASAARAHVEPKDEPILYEVSVHLTAMRLDDDGDIDADLGFFSLFDVEFFRRHGDIILNTTVEQIGHDPVVRTLSYAQIEALSYDDKRGEIPLELPIYYHEQCHAIRGDFRIRIDVFDDDDSALLQWWNRLVGGVRWAAIRAAKEAVRAALTSGGSPAASALGAATGGGAAALLNPLLSEVGQSGAAEKARNILSVTLEKLLDGVPLVGEAYAWVDEQLDKLDAALEELLSTLYDYTLGLIFPERAPKEHLGSADVALSSPQPNATRNGAPIARLFVEVSPSGSRESSGRFDYEIREAVKKPADALECKKDEQQAASTQPPTGSPGGSASSTTTGGPMGQGAPSGGPSTPAETGPSTPGAQVTETPSPGTSAEPTAVETPPESTPPLTGEEEAPSEETARSDETPPESGETAAEPEKKRKPRLKFSFGLGKSLAPPAPSGPVLTRSPQLSRCADLLGANTGREHRAEGARRRSSGLSFVREDLRLYIDSKEPQITDEMKNCARLLLNFLDGNSTEGDREWIVRIYEAAYERGYAGG